VSFEWGLRDHEVASIVNFHIDTMYYLINMLIIGQ